MLGIAVFFLQATEKIEVPEIKVEERDLSKVVLSLPIKVNVPSVPPVEIKENKNETRRDFSTGTLLYASNLGYGGMFFLTKLLPFGATLYFNYSRDYFSDAGSLPKDYDSFRSSFRGKFYGLKGDFSKNFGYSEARFYSYVEGEVSSFSFRVATQNVFLKNSIWWAFRNCEPLEFVYAPSLKNSFVFTLLFGRQEGYPRSGWIYGAEVFSETYVVPGWSLSFRVKMIEDPLIDRNFLWSFLVMRNRIPHPFVLGYSSDLRKIFKGNFQAPAIGYPLKSALFWRITPTVKVLGDATLSLEMGYMIGEEDFHYDEVLKKFLKVKRDGFYSSFEYMQRFNLFFRDEFYIWGAFYPSNLYENFSIFSSMAYLKIGDFFKLSGKFSLYPDDIASLIEAQFGIKLAKNYRLLIKGSYPYPHWKEDAFILQSTPSVLISFTGFF